MKPTREQLWNEYKHKCALCGRFMTLLDVTIDHIIPKSLGGANHVDNYQPSHGKCNVRKSNQIIRSFKKTGLLRIEIKQHARKKIKHYPYKPPKIFTRESNESHKEMILMFKKAREVLNTI